MKFNKSFVFSFVCLATILSKSDLAFSSPPAVSTASCRTHQLSLNKLVTEQKRSEYKLLISDRRVTTADKRSIRQAALIEKSNTKIKSLQELVRNGASACEANRRAINCSKIRVAQKVLPKLSSKLILAQEKLKRYQAATELLSQASAQLKVALAQIKTNVDQARQVLASCTAAGNSSSSSSDTIVPGTSQSTYDYAVNLNSQVGKKFPINQGFSLAISGSPTLQLEAAVTPFYYLNGTNSGTPTTDYPFSLEVALSQIEGAARDVVGMWPSNVNVTIRLPTGYCASSAEFQFINYGGELNLGVNSGTIKSSRSYIELFDTSLAGIAVSGSSNVGPSSGFQETGIVTLGGYSTDCISKIVFGGQELWVQSIVFKQVGRSSL